VGATTYQLTVGLIFGQPTTAGFVLSFFALVGCVVLLGNTAMALLLPDRRTAIGKYLERILSQATATILRQPRQLAQGYLRDLEAIRKQGADLESAINGQIARLHQEIVLSSETSSQPEDSTSRLYATQ
jgi:hypothetical protein